MAEKKNGVELVVENRKLREENADIRRDNTTRMVSFLCVSFVANVFFVWLAFFHFPQVQYAWTSNAGVVCKVSPITEPHLNQQVVANFALQAAVSIYSYDYVNYRRQITTVSEMYFTPEFRDKFIPMFGDSQNLKDVIDHSWTVSAFQNDRKPPQLSKTGNRHSDGAYFWEVQVPLNVYYSVGRQTKADKVLATVTVIRTDPSRMNPSGIAVDNIVTAQLVE